jgi:DNA-binding MarR family transcriptional regulator
MQTSRVTEDSARHLLSALRRLTGAFTAMGHRFGERHKLSRSEVAALIVIIEATAQGASIGTVDLARKIGMSAPSATVLIDRLVSTGLVIRKRHESDGRRVVLTPTETARAAGREHFGAMNDVLLEMLKSHSAKDLETAANILDQAADLVAAQEDARP